MGEINGFVNWNTTLRIFIFASSSLERVLAISGVVKFNLCKTIESGVIWAYVLWITNTSVISSPAHQTAVVTRGRDANLDTNSRIVPMFETAVYNDHMNSFIYLLKVEIFQWKDKIAREFMRI